MGKDEVLIERMENYCRQSYRNRCHIYGANGLQCLVIPVKRGSGDKMPVTEVETDDSRKWQQVHWKSIVSAYRLSPYFDFYADDFSVHFNRRAERLFDWNQSLLSLILGMLHIDKPVRLTQTYRKPDPSCPLDFRQGIHPKSRFVREDASIHYKPYHQVFGDRFGFIPNLSIIDLLFNEGPAAAEIIRSSLTSSAG